MSSSKMNDTTRTVGSKRLYVDCSVKHGIKRQNISCIEKLIADIELQEMNISTILHNLKERANTVCTTLKNIRQDSYESGSDVLESDLSDYASDTSCNYGGECKCTECNGDHDDLCDDCMDGATGDCRWCTTHNMICKV
jgi:hypothetical protein